MAQGVSLSYWSKLGYPSAITIWVYNNEGYPGHSLECLRFPEQLMEESTNSERIEYTVVGTGIDCNGYDVHIGDTKDQVKEAFQYADGTADATEYELGCYFCETEYLLLFEMEYDGQDKLCSMAIIKESYNE